MQDLPSLIREIFVQGVPCQQQCCKRLRVLQLAFPAGDVFGGLFRSDNDVFETALGYDGPAAAMGATQPPWQIDKNLDYGHGDYLPPSDAAVPPAAGKWNLTAGFMTRAYRGQPQSWPT